MKKSIKTIVITLMSLGACACSGGGPESAASGADENATEQGPSRQAVELAKIEFSDGSSVTFLEGEPGAIFVSEHAPVGSAPLYSQKDRKELGPVRLYEQLSGEAAPQALVDAGTRRADAAVRASGARPHDVVDETTAPQAVSTSPRTLSPQALRNDQTPEEFQQYNCPIRENHFNWINVTGTGMVQRSGVHYFQSAAMALEGSVWWVYKSRTWYTWTTVKNEEVREGWHDRVDDDGPSGGSDFDARSTVSQADGAGYSMCTHWS